MRSGAVAVVLGALVVAGLAWPAQAASPLVSIEAVTVEPPSPAADALCRLSVRLKNAGTQTATNFRFQVKTGGQELTVYKVETYAANVEPGTSGTVALHAFWIPSAAKGSFPVEVTLTEAQWAQVKREGQTTTTTPTGSVEGLPASSTETLHLAAAK